MKLPQHFSNKPDAIGRISTLLRLPFDSDSLSPSLSPLVPHGAREKTGALGRRSLQAFTMVEIAICLGVIGFALVAIIGVLPIGMSVQKDNREQTVINFDANYLMNALRNGALGQDNLTNYIFNITNISISYNALGQQVAAPPPFTNSYTTSNSVVGGRQIGSLLTNGFNIIGLLGTPKYVPLAGGGFTSNSITADFRAISGTAMDLGTNQGSRDFAFTYRVTVENIPSGEFPFGVAGNVSAPLDAVTNGTPTDIAARAATWIANNKFVQDNFHEIRLQFRWPILPNHSTPPANRQIYRTSASGQLVVSQTSPPVKPNGVPLYFIDPQSYVQ